MHVMEVQQMQKRYHRAALVCVLITAALFCSALAPQHKPTLLIMPFRVSAATELAYLSDGIAALLPSRIDTSGTINVIGGDTAKKTLNAGAWTDPQRLLAHARRLKADFILKGVITARGEKISVEAHVIEVNRPQNIFPVSLQVAGIDLLISEADRLAERIREIITPVGSRYPIETTPDALQLVTPTQPCWTDPRPTGSFGIHEEPIHENTEPLDAESPPNHHGK